MATSGIAVTVDSRGLRVELARRLARAQHAARVFLYQKAEEVMTASKHACPVVTGNLRESGHVQRLDGGDRVVIGYGGPAAPYAWRVHENPRAGKTQGRSPSGKTYQRYSQVGGFKFLENPFRRLTEGIDGELAAVVRRAMR